MLEQLSLAAGQSALDVGCGTGDDVAAIAEIVGPAGRAVGLDHSEAMIAEATSRHGTLPGVSFQVGDAQRLPFDSESFDGCRAERVLQHLIDPDGAVGEMARVLKRGGRLAMMDADWDTLVFDGADPDLSGRIWRSNLLGVRQPRIGRRLRALLLRNGFTDVRFEAAPVVGTEFEYAKQQFALADAASQAVESERVSEQEAAQWLEDLEQASRADRFLYAALSFRVAGRKA